MSDWRAILHRLRVLAEKPADEAARWRVALYLVLTLARHCWHHLWVDRAPRMAAALTYYTIFGLIPLFVVALVVFRAFGGFEDLGQEVQTQVYQFLGLSQISVQQVDRPTVHQEKGEVDPFAIGRFEPSPNPDSSQTPAEARTESKKKTLKLVSGVIDRLSQRVRRVNFTSIGAVGLVLLIGAAIGLVVTVEDSFNEIYHTHVGRPWLWRIAIYWAVITLGPLLLGTGLWLTGQVIDWAHAVVEAASLPGQQVDQALSVAGQWLMAGLSQLAAWLSSWVLLFLLYVLMPNTSVRVKPAAIGALVVALLWELAKWLFRLYLINAVGYSALYGTLGLIPLFLFWLYLTWMLVLFGLELTYVLQMMDQRTLDAPGREDEQEHQGLIDPRWVIPLMAMVGEAFARGKPTSAERLAERSRLPIDLIERLGQHLEQEKLIHRMDVPGSGDVRYTLARPAGDISVSQLLNIGHTLSLREVIAGDVLVPGREILDRLHHAQQDAAAQATLADILQDDTPPEPAPPLG